MRARTTGFLGCTVLLTFAAACAGASEAGPDTPPHSEPNPGAAFDGTYRVTGEEVLRDGQPPDSTASSFEFTWVVQSVCEGTTGPCTAVVTPTDPDPATNLNNDSVRFVYEGGEWSRVAERVPTPCISFATGQPIDEPFAGLDETVLTAEAGPAPVQSLTGRRTALQMGSCLGISEFDVSVRRTGDVPTDIPAPTEVPRVEEVVVSPGSVFDGAYRSTIRRTKTVDGSPAPTEPVVTDVRATPEACTRTGDKCIISLFSGDDFYGLFMFVDGKFTSSGTERQRLECPQSPDGLTDPRVRSWVLDRWDDGRPAGQLSGRREYTYTGACVGNEVDESVYDRIGD